MRSAIRPAVRSRARLYVVTVEIFEAATSYAYAVVSHSFAGRTKKEAWRYHDSHLKSDRFLRDCEMNGKFGDVKCRSVVTYDGWVTT